MPNIAKPRTDIILDPTSSDWWQDIDPADLPRQFQEIAGLFDQEDSTAYSRMDILIKLAVYFGGQQIYLPKIDALIVRQRDRLIRRDRAMGYTYRDLARKYQLTEVWIRQIVDHIDPQVRLFD